MLIRFLITILIVMLPVASFGQTLIQTAPETPDGSVVEPGDAVDLFPTGDLADDPDLRGGDIEFEELRQPERISANSGVFQRVWDDAPADAGVRNYSYCDDCVYRVRTRELMVTTIVLPEDHEIHSIDIGNKVGYDYQVRYGNMISIHPTGFGNDTSMNVFTNYGVLSFYLRAESFDSDNIPDIRIMIQGNNILEKLVDKYAKADKKKVDRDLSDLPQLSDSSNSGKSLRKKTGDYVEFDPSSLRGWSDYSLWGDEVLEPETVYRDDYFTYVFFGEKWIDIELPVAFVVIDGIDETVNSRIQGTTMVIESTSPRISLKSGESYLCIEYEGV